MVVIEYQSLSLLDIISYIGGIWYLANILIALVFLAPVLKFMWTVSVKVNHLNDLKMCRLLLNTATEFIENQLDEKYDDMESDHPDYEQTDKYCEESTQVQEQIKFDKKNSLEELKQKIVLVTNFIKKWNNGNIQMSEVDYKTLQVLKKKHDMTFEDQVQEVKANISFESIFMSKLKQGKRKYILN